MSLATDLLSIQVSALAGDLESPTNVAYRLGFVGGLAVAITTANELAVGADEDWKNRYHDLLLLYNAAANEVGDLRRRISWFESRIAELEALLGDLVPDAEEEVIDESRDEPVQ